MELNNKDGKPRKKKKKKIMTFNKKAYNKANEETKATDSSNVN